MRKDYTARILQRNREEVRIKPLKVRGPWDEFSEFKHGVAFGLLTLDKRGIKSRAGTPVCRCTCMCGEAVHLSLAELQFRKKVNAGCGSSGCQYTSRKYKAGSRRYFIETQIRRILYSHPDLVVPEWGGNAYPGVDPVPLELGVRQAMHDLDVHIKERTRKECSLLRRTKALPYSADNCMLSVHGDSRKVVKVGGVKMTVAQLARLYQLPVHIVSEAAHETDEGPGFMTALVEAQCEKKAAASPSTMALVRKPHSTEMDYNPMAKKYNAKDVGECLTVRVPIWMFASGLREVFVRRGLKEDQDFAVTLVIHDERGNKVPSRDKRYAVEKLSHAEVRTI